jgi:hypothetical protein
MKSQRRHELKDNALAKKIFQLPSFTSRYGLRIALVLVLVILVSVFITQQISASKMKGDRLTTDISAARSAILQLRQSVFYSTDAEYFASKRDEARKNAQAAIDDIILTASNDPKFLAQAYIAKGDLNWTLANLGNPASLTTRPALMLDREPSAYLQAAEDAYNTVFKQYTNADPLSYVSANFGLAAIAENKGDWDKAKRHLELIYSSKLDAAAFATQAAIELDMLGRLQREPIVGAAATQPATRPAIGPASPLAPALPSTNPATRSAPAARPAK